MKNDQRIVLTKKLLREGLLRLLQKKDIGKITVSELCEESGINRTTFYRHYHQPRDIVIDIRHDLFNSVKSFSKENNALLNPKLWLENICQFFYERSELLKIVILCRTDEEFVSFINEMYKNYFNEILGPEYNNRFDENELKLTTYYFAGGIYYVLRQWIIEPIDKTPKEIADIMYKLLPEK